MQPWKPHREANGGRLKAGLRVKEWRSVVFGVERSRTPIFSTVVFVFGGKRDDMGGVNQCSLTLSFGEIPWFDDQG
jgi:hypothetical protein